MQHKKVQRLAPLLGAVLALIAVAALGVGPTLGQPVPPNSYYGVAETSERVAPEGTTIVAVANGAVQDSITVGSSGQYGSASGDKLRVDSEIDSEVTFHIDSVNGPQAAETDPDPTGDVERLSLTFPDGAFDDTTPVTTPTQTGTSTPTPTPTQTATPTPTPTQTATPAQTQTVAGTDSQTATRHASSTTAPTQSPSVADTDIADSTDSDEARGTAVAGLGETGTGTQAQSGGGGLVPWGLLRSVLVYVVLPVAGVYGVLKAIAIYYGY